MTEESVVTIYLIALIPVAVGVLWWAARNKCNPADDDWRLNPKWQEEQKRRRASLCDND
jgi:hypothetical protein